MKIIGIIQARTGSKRFPKKVLMPILGKTLLEHMVERVKKSKYLDEIWIATTKLQSDNILESLAKDLKVKVFRGDVNNVLSRFYEISKFSKADVIVRLTGDCPLHDGELIDKIILCFLNNFKNFDYLSNTVKPTFPDGLDVEVFKFNFLEETYQNVKNRIDKEHVTTYMHKNFSKKNNNRIGHFINNRDYSRFRWTVDEKADFILIEEIYKKLYPIKEFFSWEDVIQFINKNNHLKKINNDIPRNEGYYNQIKKSKNL
jgi:spore coat polysaccharide biosynthesis protein SpsF (cytidylyltransferase family)